MKKYFKITVTANILFIIIGCTVSKDFKTPAPELPSTFRNVVTEDTMSIASLPWKEFYRDTMLQKLIDSSIIRNFDMQIALKNVEESRLRLKQSQWNNVPIVGLNIASSTNNPSNNSLNGMSTSQFLGTNHLEDYTTNVSLSWEADIWGKIRSKNKIALTSYLLTNEARKAIQTELIANVTEGYYNLIMLDEQLKIAQRNIALNESTVRMMTIQYESGQVTSLAVEQAQAQLLATQKLIPELEQATIQQENALRVLSGDLPASINRSFLSEQVILPETISAGLPSTLLRLRPDIKRKEFELALSNAKVGVSKADMYPSLRITASGGVNSLKASDWFNIPSALFGIVGASVVQPLLQHKELSTQYKVDLVEREKSVLKFRQSVVNAVGEVSDALVKIEKLKTQETLAEKRVNKLKQSTTRANDLFNNGMATYLEVIIAQGNVLQSELELALIRRSELIAISELYRSLGGGVN
ncbi:TolC family protein [Chryseobacterium sp. StRB126]|uniref:TolC family protein n=1 Tax=Chryseobacterium sp. StRB126 TaxID=878220 RepID=UPI0005EFD60C|nr:efflux transporter outer membrane subunit [Chryseobacterium sp. StRB126]